MAVIRRARPGEAAALTRLILRSKAHWGYDEAFMARAASELALTEAELEQADVLVAERDGVPLGVASVAHDADPPLLDLLFVEPTAIGTGVGAALLDAALAAARSRGIAELRIVSDPNAEPFYRARGAVPETTERSPTTGRDLPVLRIVTGGPPSDRHDAA